MRERERVRGRGREREVGSIRMREREGEVYNLISFPSLLLLLHAISNCLLLSDGEQLVFD